MGIIMPVLEFIAGTVLVLYLAAAVFIKMGESKRKK